MSQPFNEIVCSRFAAIKLKKNNNDNIVIQQVDLFKTI